MEVRGDRFEITWHSASATVRCSGTLDMRGKEGYRQIIDLLDEAVSLTSSGIVTLDVKALEFLNSSGITALGGFIIKLRNKGGIRLAIRCSHTHTWQARSMKGLEKLMPDGLEIIFE
ncbi:MAG: hypothetical protein BWK80_44060 [Desulfobacteraceae bacterium IS3]|nr:MAG: hypothetical protein BWK80_44060 [Desulfobacteraceae bacterium IS3]